MRPLPRCHSERSEEFLFVRDKLALSSRSFTRCHSERSEESLFAGLCGCNVFSNVAPTATRPARAPLLFHRPREARSHLFRPCRFPRRSPPKIPRLRPIRLRRPLHHQNRNRNLPGVNWEQAERNVQRGETPNVLVFSSCLIAELYSASNSK